MIKSSGASSTYICLVEVIAAIDKLSVTIVLDTQYRLLDAYNKTMGTLSTGWINKPKYPSAIKITFNEWLTFTT